MFSYDAAGLLLQIPLDMKNCATTRTSLDVSDAEKMFTLALFLTYCRICLPASLNHEPVLHVC